MYPTHVSKLGVYASKCLLIAGGRSSILTGNYVFTNLNSSVSSKPHLIHKPNTVILPPSPMTWILYGSKTSSHTTVNSILIRIATIQIFTSVKTSELINHNIKFSCCTFIYFLCSCVERVRSRARTTLGIILQAFPVFILKIIET